jgi:hypothetical protein
MAVEWTIRESTLSLLLQGTYAFEEVTAAMQSALSDPRFAPGSTLLIDERASASNPSAAEKRARVAWISSLRPRIAPRVALVAGTEPLRFGIARMASAFFEMEGVQAAVFTDLPSAQKWLRAPGPSPSPEGERAGETRWMGRSFHGY